jgi:hypothetical protein
MRSIALLFGLALLSAPSAALAQPFPVAATAEFASGVEGGGRGHASGVRRMGTLFRIGGEMLLSEIPGPRVAAGLLLTFEPRTAVGADIRYVHLVGDRFALHVGAVGIFAPSTLFGASAGAELRLPLGRRVSLTAGPALQAFFVGNDLPDGFVIWQGLLHVGVHVNLFH